MTHADKLQITGLIHENCSRVLAFAFSRESLNAAVSHRFKGSWKFLDRLCFEIAEVQAERALLELATHLRILDDTYLLGETLKGQAGDTFGEVLKSDGTTEVLYFRDLTNKVLHSSKFEWLFADPDMPCVTCHAVDRNRWISARVELLPLAGVCGRLGS